jgi:pimeloyl-ACP methyl ester carboxylesterase
MLRPNDVPLRQRTVTTEDGVLLPIFEAGRAEAPPIVFVHGLASSHNAWNGVLQDPRLQAQHRLISYDLRGHGEQSTPFADDVDPGGHLEISEHSWTSDLDAVLSGLDDYHLVGWSFGCRIIEDWMCSKGGLGGASSITLACGPSVLGPVAADDPAAALVMPTTVATLTGVADGGELAYSRLILALKEQREPAADLLQSVMTAAALTQPDAIRAAVASPFDHRDFFAALPESDRKRILALVCEEDQLFHADALLATWSQANVKTQVIAKQPHGWPLTDPTMFASAVLSNARKSDPNPASR